MGPRLADDDQNHSTPSVLMLVRTGHRWPVNASAYFERKDFTPTWQDDGSAQVISSYMPTHACEVLVLVLLGSAARVRHMIQQHRMQKVQVRRGTRGLALPRLFWKTQSGPPSPTPYQDHYHYCTEYGTVSRRCQDTRMPGCQDARIRTVSTGNF